jgi:hypothetical protein
MELNDVAILVLSVGAIVIGCVGKKFYEGTSTSYTATSSKPAPTWLGRLMFIGVGLIILIPEIIHLISN